MKNFFFSVLVARVTVFLLYYFMFDSMKKTSRFSESYF